MKAILEAGKVCNVHGVRGQVKIFPWTDSPYVYDNFSVLFIDNKEYSVGTLKLDGSDFAFLSLIGVTDRNFSELLRGKEVYAYKNQIKKSAVEQSAALFLLQRLSRGFYETLGLYLFCFLFFL